MIRNRTRPVRPGGAPPRVEQRQPNRVSRSFFIDEEAQRQGFAYAFASEVERDAFFQKWELEHPREAHAQSVTDSVFYEHTAAGGDSFTLPQYTAEPDLTRYGCFLRVQCRVWNDRISSYAY